MQSDFSASAKAARAALLVPELPMDSIHRRSRAIGRNDRIRSFAAGGAIALGAVGASALGMKLYDGIGVWLSGDRAAVVARSFAIENAPMPADLKALSDRATFPVVYPAGLPSGARLARVIYAPFDRPSQIVVSYRDMRGNFNAGFALIDSRTLGSGLALLPNGSPAGYGKVRQWRAGAETVIVSDNVLSPDVARAVRTAMQRVTPAQSLQLAESSAWNVRLLGGSDAAALAAERLSPGGVLVDRGNLAQIPSLARTHAPLMRPRALYLTGIPYVNGEPQYQRATVDAVREVAIPANGVRAIAAVMGAAASNGAQRGCCEIYYTAPANGRYEIWTVPVAGTEAARKYAVDAATYSVTAP